MRLLLPIVALIVIVAEIRSLNSQIAALTLRPTTCSTGAL